MTTQVSQYNTVLSCVLFEHIIHYHLHEKKKDEDELETTLR